MSAKILRADPKKDIGTTLKEAVVDSLLNVVHASISGIGEYGAVLYGTRPRNLFSSGYLLPMKTATEGDEVTSPIWVSSHGLDFQVLKAVEGSIRLQPRFAIYVRILPNEQDIKRDDCRPTFRLRSEIAKDLNRATRDAIDAKWDEIKGEYKARREHPEWPKIRDQVREAVYTARGVPLDLSELAYSDDETPDESAGEGADKQGIDVGTAKPGAVKDELFEALNIPHKWLRLDLELPALDYPIFGGASERVEAVEAHHKAMDDAIAKRLSAWLEEDTPDFGGKLWAFRKEVSILPSQFRDWRRFLEELRKSNKPPAVPAVVPRWNIVLAPDWLDNRRLNVHVALENKSKPPPQHVEETDPCLFQATLETDIPCAIHHRMKLERVEPSYRYNQYLSYPASGFNGGVVTREIREDRICLETTWAPRYTQPRIVPTAYDDIECRVRELSKPECFENLKPLSKHFEVWLKQLRDKIDLSAGLDAKDTEGLKREKQKFETDMKAWASEAAAIKTGLSMLEESRKHWEARGRQGSEAAIPFEAWLAMNEAMANLMEEKLENPEWRLFQLAFILANISAIATRLDTFKKYYVAERDDAVTLLYFPTGGGKSEAFFGLLVFALFFDRLRNKRIGVTAMIRYPLRLLTIQQAQRASRVLAKAELVRRKHSYGGQPLSIGFWVGSGGSPNRHNSDGVEDIPKINKTPADQKTEDALLESSGSYKAAVRAWNKIPRCPFCGGQTALRNFPDEGDTLAHVCCNRDCESNGGTFKPLPFYICDEDIYDFAPSVVLGTVDKLALIGHHPKTIRRVLGMFGAAPWRDKGTGRIKIPTSEELQKGPESKECVGIKPAYPVDGAEVFTDPFPALLIQDEAHLLDESLGTFAGLFESALDSIFAELFTSLKDIAASDPDGKRRRAKVIAASATVSEPERQLEHLYQRRTPAIQFPYPGPDLYSSFYAHPCIANEEGRTDHPDIEVRSKQARIYAGFMTNGRPHTATSVAVLSNFHLIITELFNAFTSGDNEQANVIKGLMTRYVSKGPLHSIYTASIHNAGTDKLATLIDLHRIALTYVTNKKGGDQIMSAESEETRKRHDYYGLPFEQLLTRLITGSIDQGEIQNVVDTAQSRPAPGQPFPPLTDALRSVIATSAVSHGVDVEEFNSMFFAGLPSDVAEYIQASSRVGRTHVGFCVLVPTPQRRRDRFVVEVFDVYHRFLERMVQPAAIDRWAERAVERVLPSLFQSFICGVAPSRGVIEKAQEGKSRVKANDLIPDILRWYSDGHKAFMDGVLGFIERSLGLDTHFAPPEESLPYYKEVIERRIRLILDRISETDWRSAPLPTFFRAQPDPLWRPMTSLRDVDQGGIIRLSVRDYKGDYQDAAAVKSVMAFIRNGLGDAGDDPEQEG